MTENRKKRKKFFYLTKLVKKNPTVVKIRGSKYNSAGEK